MNFALLGPLLTLAGAAFALYIGSRLGVFALAEAARGDQAVGPATLAQWLPIAAVATLAVRDMPDVSISLIFASSVACLSLVLGTTLFAAPTSGALESRHRRAWGMVLPAAVLALMAGFAAQFTLKHAVIFALQGIVALLMWTATGHEPTSEDEHAASDVRYPRSTSNVKARVACLTAWLVLTLAGAWFILRAAGHLTHEVPRLTGGTIAALVISPVLVLPMIGSSLNWAHERHAGAAVSCAMGCTLLNLCLLLPVVIVASRVLGAWRRGGGADALLRGKWLDPPDQALVFPMAVWRVDTVLLILLGAALLLFSTGRWTPRRAEGLGLLMAFAFYLIKSAALSLQ
jgi:Ca2+/Na+ antiporter